jgi:hypothetical protein
LRLYAPETPGYRNRAWEASNASKKVLAGLILPVVASSNPCLIPSSESARAAMSSRR